VCEYSMANIVLLRHAEVVQVPEIPTRQWKLSDEGKAVAMRLGTHPILADVQFFLSGDEAKMVETATACARSRPVVTSPKLRELNRDAAGWLLSDAAYFELVRKVLSHPQENIQGCESAASVQERVVKAVDEVLNHEPDKTFAVVSGGLALALYLSYLQSKSVPDLTLWRRIRFPDIAVVDPNESRVIHSFGSSTGV
jgi:broad specificity phosphatase PhoE